MVGSVPEDSEEGHHLSRPLSDGGVLPGPYKGVRAPEEARPAAHNESSGVGGSSGREGGARDDYHSAHLPRRAGHGRSDARDLDVAAVRKPSSTAAAATSPTGAEQEFESSLHEKSTPPADDSLSVKGPDRPERPVSLPLRNVASPRKTPFQGPPATSPNSRPNSLLLNDPPAAGSLLDSLRKDSPVEALQEDFFRRNRRRPSSPSQKREERFVPVEVDEKRRAVPVGGRRERERSPSPPASAPLSPALSQSSAEPDGSESDDALESSCEAPSECLQVRRASSDSEPTGTVFTFDRPKNQANAGTLNDLGISSVVERNLPNESLTKRKLNFEPNINTSPESNLTDESESSSDERDDQRTFPFSLRGKKGSEERQRERTEISQQKDRTESFGVPSSSSPLSDVTNKSDVTESTLFANERRPEIPSDDVMGCERPLAPRARVPLRSAKEDSSPRFSRVNRPRDLLLQEERGDAENGRRRSGDMGGVFSRGRKPTPPRVGSELPPESPSLPSTPPSAKGVKTPQQPFTPEEGPVPSYVRTRAEPSKRYSGFGHVSSDNVRRMRDVWGSKQDPKPPQTPPRSHRVPPSPTRPSSRRSSDAQGRNSPLNTPGSESPRSKTFASVERERFSPLKRTSPSPSRGTSSPSYTRPSSDRFFGEKTPPSPKTTKPTSPPYSNYPRRGSQGSQGRASPVPSSPCRRCSRGARESPVPSPSLERRQRYDYNRRSSEEKSRSRTSSKASPTLDKEPPSKKSPLTRDSGPQEASKVHQKIFRRLRDASLQPDSEAICFKEEEEKYKMVLDVEEYVPGEIEVLQDDKVLTVKGRVETRERRGHVSVKTFHRTFNIPKNSREEDIDSALSKDGILTIYVPKKRERVIKIELVD